MLRLTLWNTAETKQFNIDLYEHAPVNLNYQFSDVTEINKAKGSYSQTFRVPATKANSGFFQALHKPTLQPSTNYKIKKKIRAALNYNSIPLMVGYVQIKNIYIQKKDFSDIELVFFGETLDLVRSLQEKNISDLDTGNIDHTLNAAAIGSSWQATGLGTFPFNGTVRYGIMDKGRNWSNLSTTSADNYWAFNQSDSLWQGDMTPYVSAKWLVDKIMDEGGFTYDSVLFGTTDFQNIFLPAYNGSLTPRSEDNDSEAQVIAVGLASDFPVGTGSDARVPLLDTTTGSYDYANNWNNTTHEWTAPYLCEITVTLSVTTSTYGTATAMSLRKILAGTTTEVWIAWAYQPQITETVILHAGDKLLVQATGSTVSDTAVSGTTGNDGTTWLRIDSVSEPLGGQLVTMSDNFPEIKQIDFLISLQKMFNLVFVPDTRKPNHLIIEPMQDYLTAGTKKDWTNKVDYTKDVVITPTTDIQRNDITWTNDKGQDFLNIAIQLSADRVYGRYKVQDTDNDFATGTQEVRTALAPYVMSYIPSTEVVIHRCLDSQGNGVKVPKARLAYWNGLTVNYSNFWLRLDSGTPTSVAFFPQFSNYSAVNPNVADNDLNFGYERAFFAMDSHPLNTMYYRYWMSYVNELYSEDARLLSAYIQINRADIQDFEFSDNIFIRDTYYRILKIHNYDATIGGAVKVDFIKILSDVVDCAYTPTGQLSNGVITFNNSSSNYGNRECCQRYGYVWVARKGGGVSQCYPTSLIPEP